MEKNQLTGTHVVFFDDAVMRKVNKTNGDEIQNHCDVS